MAASAGVPDPARALRLFLVFAALSLVPVLILGVVLAASYRTEAAARGLAESKAEAGLFARSGIEPLVTGYDLDQPLPPRQLGGLQRLAQTSIAAGDLVRFRLRTTDGRVVFSSDASVAESDDDGALDAAKGETVAEVTDLNADADLDASGNAGDPGVRVAEVYRPLMSGATSTPTGVLELYLPYDPIAHDAESGLHSLYRDLALGLGLLYLVLAAISWSVTRKLRSQVVRNAHLAEYDQLTGLPNRMAFTAQLEQAIESAEQAGVVLAVALVDLDRFQEINDTLGHSTGDALLVELGHHLAEHTRGAGSAGGYELVARLGGDEYGVVVIASDDASLRESVAALGWLVNREFDLSGLPVEVESSIGVARAPYDGADAGTLLQHADVAMYLAKRNGGGVAYYDRGLDQYDAERLALVADMRRALAADELALHYQPKIDAASGSVHAVEALVRWHHPDRGLLMPDRFVPVVEQTGMIDAMTAWVVDAALAWVTTPGPTAAGIRVAVNVSARNLVHPSFPEQVMASLRAHGATPDRLSIEVTETALVADQQRVTSSLMRLSAAGVRISIDDFGRGQTSLSQLSLQPVDEVKIDKEFVMDMGEVAAHAAIVRSVIDLAHNLGFEVVAEGVETGDVLDALRLAGCDIAQGYHIARPMPADQLEVWLAERVGPAAHTPQGPAATLLGTPG